MVERIAVAGLDGKVSRLCFGCEQLGGTDWGKVDVGEVESAVGRAVDAGINFFDTADVYGLGRSEERLAAALGSRRHDVVIATKAGVGWTPRDGRAAIYIDCSPNHLRDAIENSLRRLRLDRIALFQLHRYDASVPLERTLDALRDLQTQGKIGAIGYSNYPLDALRRAHAILPASTYQLSLNLINHREVSKTVEFCRMHGIAVLTFGVLAQGLLSGKYKSDVAFESTDRRYRLPHFQESAFLRNGRLLEALSRYADSYGRSSASIAIRWTLDYPGVTCAILGCKSNAQLDENLRSCGWTLSEADRCALAELASPTSDEAEP